jgi:hypothetical protein
LRGFDFMKNWPVIPVRSGLLAAKPTTRDPFSALWKKGMLFMSFGTAAAGPVRLSPKCVRLGPGLTAFTVMRGAGTRLASS